MDALSLHPLINRQFGNDCFLQAMMIDWSSSILLSFQVTFHILSLEIHLWLYRTDIVLIDAHIACQAVKITPFCRFHCPTTRCYVDSAGINPLNVRPLTFLY